LNIALDATYSVGDDLSGVGVYSREMLEGLARTYTDAKFTFCCRMHRFLRSSGRPLPANARRYLLSDSRVPQSADVFHGLNQRLPRSTVRHAVTTFHDLFVLTGEYSTPEFRRRFADQARDAAERSERIIAVSQFTAQQVTGLLGVERSRVHVVHHGVRVRPATDIAREKIILHVGAIQSRKNIARLVDAFEAVDKDWKLVLAGGSGYGAAEILQKIEASRHRERIQVLGYVPDLELAAWYARAMIFAFPSLDEGFGMPVLEAMAAGTPVIASNRAAVPEVAGEAAWLVNPEDTAELSAALSELARNPAQRAELSRRGLDRAAEFTWDQAIEKTWQVYSELARDRPD
jgi:glycosyltransferase involved in cell wall biosynthesis